MSSSSFVRTLHCFLRCKPRNGCRTAWLGVHPGTAGHVPRYTVHERDLYSNSTFLHTSPYHHITISPYHHITISPYHHITLSANSCILKVSNMALVSYAGGIERKPFSEDPETLLGFCVTDAECSDLLVETSSRVSQRETALGAQLEGVMRSQAGMLTQARTSLSELTASIEGQLARLRSLRPSSAHVPIIDTARIAVLSEQILVEPIVFPRKTTKRRKRRK